jgi:hemerythrin-like domain-containing protein
MKPRGQLMIEHRLIEKLLAAAASLSDRMNSGNYDPVLIDSIVDFIRTYADRTHHGKEEDILFRELSKKALAGDDLAAMNGLIDEHGQARARVRRLTELNERFRNGDVKAVPEIREIFLWLVGFYPAHIRKEDRDFFPKTEKYFNAGELEAMLQEFWSFDRNMIHEKYTRAVEDISRSIEG